jgi:hypothetical protein
MTSITLYNKGKRTWTDLVNSAGQTVILNPEGSIEMEEAAGLRMLVDYPREFTSSKIAGPSSEDLARREQSLKDRSANLDAREKALDERDAALKDGKRGPGRPSMKTDLSGVTISPSGQIVAAKVEGAAPEIK